MQERDEMYKLSVLCGYWKQLYVVAVKELSVGLVNLPSGRGLSFVHVQDPPL